MVDVTQHKIFPTIVSEFKYDIGSEEHSIVLKELRSSETKMILQTKDNLHTKLPLFKKKVFETTEKVCREFKFLYNTTRISSYNLNSHYCFIITARTLSWSFRKSFCS